MKNQSPDQSRRALLKGMVAIPVVTLAGFQTSAQAAMLSVDDPTAKALAYTETSADPAKTCANCMLYTGGAGAASGPCTIFPGKEVAAAGYCNSWAAKP